MTTIKEALAEAGVITDKPRLRTLRRAQERTKKEEAAPPRHHEDAVWYGKIKQKR